MTVTESLDPAADAAPAPVPPAGPRKPWLAVLATLVAPGLGHLYAGRPLRGFVAWALAAAVGFAALATTLAVDSRAARLVAFAVGLAAPVAFLADAAWTARRADPAAPRRPFQRPAVYVAVGLMVLLAVNLVLLPLARTRWRAFSLPSGNMAPALLSGDYVMTARGVPQPRRGMVVTRLADEGFEAVNRLVGLPGDTLAMRDGVLYVNGRAETGRARARDDGWPEGFDGQRDHLVGDTAGFAPTSAEWGPLVVPDGHVFTLGDNRSGSLDSRHLGFIPFERLTGRVGWIYFSREPLTGELRWHRVGRAVR